MGAAGLRGFAAPVTPMDSGEVAGSRLRSGAPPGTSTARSAQQPARSDAAPDLHVRNRFGRRDSFRRHR